MDVRGQRKKKARCMLTHNDGEKTPKHPQRWPLDYIRDGSQLVLCPQELFI